MFSKFRKISDPAQCLVDNFRDELLATAREIRRATKESHLKKMALLAEAVGSLVQVLTRKRPEVLVEDDSPFSDFIRRATENPDAAEVISDYIFEQIEFIDDDNTTLLFMIHCLCPRSAMGVRGIDVEVSGQSAQSDALSWSTLWSTLLRIYEYRRPVRLPKARA